MKGLPVIDVEEALLECRKMCKGKDFYGFGPDVFINTQSANIIIEIDTNRNDKIFIFDIKTSGYPPKNFVGTFSIVGGNWINPRHKRPIDVLKNELEEELGNSRFIELLINRVRSVGDYLVIIPRIVHGNLALSADLYIDTTSIFVSKVSKKEVENVFGNSLDGSTIEIKQKLQTVLEPIFKESKPGVISFEGIRQGESKKFCWGHNVCLMDYFMMEYNIEVMVPGFDSVIVKKLSSSPNVPYAKRPETKHNRQNPLQRGLVSDTLGFEAENNQ